MSEDNVLPFQKDNVVVFPKGRDHTVPQSVEEFRANVLENQKLVFEDMVDFIMPVIISFMMSNGIDPTSDPMMRHTILISEAIKSCMYAYSDIHHPMQSLANEIDLDQESDQDAVTEESLEMSREEILDMIQKIVDKPNDIS